MIIRWGPQFEPLAQTTGQSFVILLVIRLAWPPRTRGSCGYELGEERRACCSGCALVLVHGRVQWMSRAVAVRAAAGRRDTVPSSQYVDLVLEGADRLVEQAASLQAPAWLMLAQHAQHGRTERFAVIVKTMIQGAHLNRGPLLQVATTRLAEYARSQRLTELRCLDSERAANVLEAMQAALIAGAMRDLVTDHDYQILLEPLMRAAALTRARHSEF